MEVKNPPVVRKVSVIDTLRLFAPGQATKFKARDFALYSSVASAVSRLNAATPGSYSLATDDNGETYTVTRTR